MGSIGRYIFRTTLGAFLFALISMTGLIWITQALREIDLMTDQGQSVWVFLLTTALIIPHLLLLISPIALVLAVAHVLNKLGTDSEIIVMNASGMSPWRLFRPIFAVAAIVSVATMLLSAYIAPESLRAFRRWLTDVRTDMVTYIVRPGQFVNLQKGVVFHIHERLPNGELRGVLLDDKRNRQEHVSILADRGEILKNDHGTFLILQNGTVQRHEVGETDPDLVVFDRYAFDLSQFASPVTVNYSVRERYFWELIWPDKNDRLAANQPGRIQAELHDRILAPFYPVVFILIAYAYLGAPRTTRQSRNLSLVGVGAIVIALRFLGFAMTVLAASNPIAILVQYLAMGSAIGLSIWAIGRGIIIEPPAFVTNAVAALTERFARRLAPA
jgi:lipopolysaccharide export system permease protein